MLAHVPRVPDNLTCDCGKVTNGVHRCPRCNKGMCACHGRGVGDEGHGQQRMCGTCDDSVADVNGLTPVPRTNSAAAGNEPMSNAAEVFHATPAHVPTDVQDGDSHSQSTLREATSLRPFARVLLSTPAKHTSSPLRSECSQRARCTSRTSRRGWSRDTSRRQ